MRIVTLVYRLPAPSILPTSALLVSRATKNPPESLSFDISQRKIINEKKKFIRQKQYMYAYLGETISYTFPNFARLICTATNFSLRGPFHIPLPLRMNCTSLSLERFRCLLLYWSDFLHHNLQHTRTVCQGVG